MVGKRSASIAAVTALLLGAAGPAFADAELPSSDTALVEVYVKSHADVDKLSAQYDLAEYKRVEDDGTIVLNIDADPGERAALRAAGYKIGRTIEDASTRAAVADQRDATTAAESLADRGARDGLPRSGVKVQGRSAVPTPGETVIQRANKFTSYAGTFLYVEAFNKNTAAVTPSDRPCASTGPTLSLSYAIDNGNGSEPVSMGSFVDCDPSVNQYMYHRQLVRLTGAAASIPADRLRVRVASSTPAVDESGVTEWLGKGLPPHADGYLTGFVTKYMDPTEVRDRLDALASEFPNLMSSVNLPNLTAGYQRKSMAMVGGTTRYTGATGDLQGTQRQLTVILTSKAWGQEGGDEVSIEMKNPGVADSPLSVSVTGKAIVVSLATGPTGALTSTAKQVVDAINANPDASALVLAQTYRGVPGSGISQPTLTASGARGPVQLDDFLIAPASVQRGPFQQRVYRVGAHRDGSKVGVFLYCQQHAREWATGLTCLETAERLVRNYAIDPETKTLLDNLEVFIIANSNPDGAHYSMYDFSGQQRNLTNHCAPNTFQDAMARDAWGVDLDRNNGEYTLFDGYFGADSSCVIDVFAGPGEYSEPEIRNEKWVVDTFPNIKFANNIHSYGGYFMWAPGAYKNDATRTTAPAPNIGIEAYFFEAGERILRRIKDYRNTVILPERTGPIADVLYSAAGNSVDDQWYRKGIISYSFQTGADRFLSTSTGTDQTPVGFQPCFAGVGTGGDQGACPASGLMVNEGRDEAMEFAAGNFGLLESAYDYATDTTAPVADLDSGGVTQSKDPINYRFTLPGEAAVIHYTTDGSVPTLSSPVYDNQRARGIGEVLTGSAPGASTVKWLAVDIKGNQSAVRSQVLLVDQTAPSITIDSPADGAVFTQGRPVPVSFACADDAGGSGVASCSGSTPNGGMLPTGTAGVQTFTVTARDAVGNESTKSVSYRVLDATNVGAGVGGSVPSSLSLTLGSAPSFGSFQPGVDRAYTAQTIATVLSTAGDATLAVADPGPANTGKLVNGAFTLAQPIQANANGAAFAPIGGSANPTTLLSYAGPKSNDAVTINLQQTIGRNEALRSGSYSKTLTFTLSTTTP